MQIFICCQQSLQNHPIPAYQFWEIYFKRGIEEANHKWIEAKNVDWAEGLVSSETEKLKQWRDHTWTITIAQIKKQHQKRGIDLFLSYLYPQQILPSAIREIQDLGIPCVNFFCDHVREFTKVPQEFHNFDLNWVPEYKALKIYQRSKLNYIHAPMPVWVAPIHRNYQFQEQYNTTFIGSKDKQRSALLAEVINLGVDIEIRGTGWHTKLKDGNSNNWSNSKYKNIDQTIINQIRFLKNQGIYSWLRKTKSKWQKPTDDSVFKAYIRPKPNFDEYIKIIQQSIITLGINRYPSFRHSFAQPDTYSRMRDIEAPMMGACYLTEWTEGLDQMYELGKEIETYRSSEEMKEKINRLKAEPETRKAMRFNGQKRALAEHSFNHSLNKITRALGIK